MPGWPCNLWLGWGYVCTLAFGLINGLKLEYPCLRGYFRWY